MWYIGTECCSRYVRFVNYVAEVYLLADCQLILSVTEKYFFKCPTVSTDLSVS